MIVTFLVWHAISKLNDDTAEVAIQHLRASKAVEMIRTIEHADPHNPITLTADDRKGVVLVKGSKQAVQDAKGLLALFDVERVHVPIGLSIHSSIEKVDYAVTASILNQQEWTTSDSETGASVGISPRVNADGSVTLYIVLGMVKQEPELKMVYRIKRGEKHTFGLDSFQKINADSLPTLKEKEHMASDVEVTISIPK